uniref:Uncharacterized protein n=1 Tax=Glossina austeni TaxID=7395 RepID=A0A1A9VHA5_GLOAU
MRSLWLVAVFIGNIVNLIFVALFVDKGEAAVHDEGSMFLIMSFLQMSFGIVLSTIGGFETEFVTIRTDIRFVTKNLGMIVIVMIVMIVMFVMLRSSQSGGKDGSENNDEFHFYIAGCLVTTRRILFSFKFLYFGTSAKASTVNFESTIPNSSILKEVPFTSAPAAPWRS